ncbi:MAG: hypothetical protein HOP08_08465 [Cyclobacteriaceae bacterium]|nr:hypothetical protein [Cyclobacteriaceae bacterium]
MPKIIEILKFRDAVPLRNTWYNYYGDIFVSVIRESKPYIRRKALPPDSKRDNDLSEWHRIWQYENIEAYYGVEQLGAKTYELTIEVDGVRHRIDSVVHQVAIEFQHTLSVSIEEMNSRFHAHTKKGYLAYLVIDLTKYNSSQFYGGHIDSKLDKIVSKWKKTSYCENDKLFIDFQDCIVRLVKGLEVGYITIHKLTFLHELLSLEKNFDKILSSEKERKYLQQQEAILKRRRELEHEAITFKNLKIQEKVEFLENTLKTPDFRYLKQCFEDNVIRPYTNLHNEEIFTYRKDTETENDFVENWHVYYSTDSQFELLYKTVGKLEPKQVYINGYARIKKEYKYLFAEIVLRDKFRTICKFKRQNSVTVKVAEEPLLF